MGFPCNAIFSVEVMLSSELRLRIPPYQYPRCVTISIELSLFDVLEVHQYSHLMLDLARDIDAIDSSSRSHF